MRPRLVNWPLMRASRNPPRILFRERTSLCGCAIRQTGSRESTATGSRTTENGAWSRYGGMAFREGSSRSALDCTMQSMPPRMRDCGGCGCDGLNRRRGRHVGPRVNRRFEVRRGVRPRAGEQWNRGAVEDRSRAVQRRSTVHPVDAAVARPLVFGLRDSDVTAVVCGRRRPAGG